MARSYSLPRYNDFSHEERIATIAVQKEAAARGLFRFPTRCSICGFTDAANPRTSGYIFAHLEDYRKPLVCYPCCRRCHAALHARFSDPGRWQRVLDANWREGEWWHHHPGGSSTGDHHHRRGGARPWVRGSLSR